jgi:hypothetical protein
MNERTTRRRLLWGALLLLIVGGSVALRLPGRLVGNAAWLAIERAALAEAADPAQFARAEQLSQVALRLAPAQERLRGAGEWLARQDLYAQRLAANRARADLAQAARQELLSAGALRAPTEQRLRDMAAQSRDVEAWLLLAGLAERWGDAAARQQLLATVGGRLPERLLARPAQAASNAPLPVGWRLEGYDWLPLHGGEHGRVRVALTWRAPRVAHPVLDVQAGLYRWEEHAIQIITADSLIRYGDMEQPAWAPLRPLPMPWRVMFHEENPSPHAAILWPDERDPANTVLRVQNVYSQTLLFTQPPLRTGAAYLFVGRIRTPQQGIVAFMEGVDGVNRWPLILALPAQAGWRDYAGVFVADAPALSRFYLGTMGGGPQAWAEFDDLALFPLTLPGP